MKKIYILSLLCMLTSVSFAQSNLKEILKNFNKPAKENVMVVSHRGDWRNARKTLFRHSRTVSTWVLIWLSWT